MQRSNESTDKILREKLLDFLCLLFGGRPKRASQRNRRAGVFEAFPGETFPRPSYGPFHDDSDGFGLLVMVYNLPLEGLFVPFHHRLDHLRRRHAGQIRAAGGGCERQPETDQVMSGIADHSLIKISDLDVDAAFGIRERSQIADMTVPANPHRRSIGHHPTSRRFKPLVKFERVTADISVCRTRHLQMTAFAENRLSLFELRKTGLLRLHPRAPRSVLSIRQSREYGSRPPRANGRDNQKAEALPQHARIASPVLVPVTATKRGSRRRNKCSYQHRYTRED